MTAGRGHHHHTIGCEGGRGLGKLNIGRRGVCASHLFSPPFLCFSLLLFPLSIHKSLVLLMVLPPPSSAIQVSSLQVSSGSVERVANSLSERKRTFVIWRFQQTSQRVRVLFRYRFDKCNLQCMCVCVYIGFPLKFKNR